MKKDLETKFRLPEEMNRRVSKEPTSIKLTEETKAYLEREAHKAGIQFIPFLRQILDDYADWLREQRKG